MFFIHHYHWIYFHILLIPLIVYSGSDSLVEYPEIKYCFSSLDFLDGSVTSSYSFLKRDLGKNCTHVYGNIVIINIFREANGSEPDLGFLSSIKEITGSLKIRNSNVSLIPLLNLRIIRGNAKLHNHDMMEGLRNSLEIVWLSPRNLSMDTIIDLRSLRSIVNGDIKISPECCKYLANIDWNELLEDPTRQSFIGKCPTRPITCSSKCPIKKDKRYCWGPLESQCQIFSKCKKRMCANRCFLSKSGDEECCNSQCLGGCTSSTTDSCIACQGVLDGNLCQPECPPKKILNRESGIPVENKLFRPLFVNICLNKCPDGLLEQEGECKSQCTYRKYERIGNQCVPCKKYCEQICAMEDVFTEYEIKFSIYSMDAVKIKKLANCTTFKGTIHIDTETFDRKSSGRVPITDPQDLWYLNNLRNISGEVYIDLKGATFKLDNLSFLSNLQVIEGHYSRDVPVSLGIYSTNISFLGLTNLKTIGLKEFQNKPIDFRNNSNLCYFEFEKFKKVLKFQSEIYISGFPKLEWCANRGKVCSGECDPALGCWGPGPAQCVSCLNVKLGNVCAKNCLAEPGFLPDKGSKTCLKCHEECLETCSGVNSNQCIGGCKHAKEDSKCVRQCSRTHYLNNATKQCESCHPDCHQRNLTRLPICTGPSAKPGSGGCNKCQSLILSVSNDNVEPRRCFNKPFLNGYFNENHPNRGDSQFSIYTEKFTDLIVTYKSCHPMCSKCTFVTDQRIRVSTTDWKGCTQCKGFWYENKCVPKCPLNLTYLRADLSNSSLGHCYRCNRQCNGCYGDGNDKCIKCNSFVLSNKKNQSKFSCVDNCPPNYVHMKSKANLSETRCEYVLLTQLEFILVILAMIFFLFLLIFIIIITKFFHARKTKRRKEKLSAYFSNANEHDSHHINQSSPPNMNHLLVISSDNLDCFFGGEILGKGTFGSVYAGKWKPHVNYFDDSSSMSSCKDKKVDVVIKVLHGSCDPNEFMDEVRIMASVRHKHCLRLIGVSFNGTQKLLISSFVPHGSMDKYLANNKKSLTGHTLLLWAEQIANGMYYLEMNHIIHRDLATRNVLIYKESHCQITDFGLSKVIKPKDEEIKIFGGMVPVRWLAIETLREGIYSHKTDVWAFAVTLWEIFTFAKIPYELIKAHEIRDEIIKGTRLCQPEICSLDIYILMLKCWSTDPVERPAFEYLWSEFKMYSNNSETYLSHPNVEPAYKNDTANNYIDVIHYDEDNSSNNSTQSTKVMWSPLSESMKSRTSPSNIIIPENIRPLLQEQPRRNILYEPANQSKSSNISMNGFSRNNGNSNYQDYPMGSDLSSTSFSYLEPITTRI